MGGNNINTAKIKDAKRMSKISFVLGVLGVCLLFAGGILAGFGVFGLTEQLDFDSSSLIHEPIYYISSKRDAISQSVMMIVPGLLIMLVGEIIATLFFQRYYLLKTDKVKIFELEARVAALEEALAKKRK